MSDRAALRGVLVPLGLLFAAVLLWTRASLDQSLGPLDFGTASWLIAAIWVGAPVVGGLLSAVPGSPEVPRAASVLGLVVGLLVALVVLFGPRTAVLTTECARLAGALPSLVVGALAVGAIVGFGMGAAEVVTAALTRRGWWFAGVPIGAAVNVVASVIAGELLFSIVVCLANSSLAQRVHEQPNFAGSVGELGAGQYLNAGSPGGSLPTESWYDGIGHRASRS